MKSAFRLPRIGASPLITQWLVVTLVLSVVAHLDRGWLVSRFALIPSRVWLGEIWRLVSWPFIEVGPLTLIMTLIVIWRFGGELARVWGDARLQRFVVHVIAGAGIATVLVSAVFGASRLARVGSVAMTDLLVIAWARQFPNRPLAVFYGLLTLSGRQLVQFTIFVNVIIAIATSPIWLMPELATCAIAAAYPQAWLRR